MVSFLHTADLHLGLKITRFNIDVARRIREARFQALERIREVARDRRVDFILIAGDLFDDHAVDFDIAKRAFDLLESFSAPVYVLSGNHDPLLAGSVWDRPPWNQAGSKKLLVLRQAETLEVLPGVLLLPCPVFRKTSLADPTAWIAGVREDGGAIRLGVAHGSLKIRDDLPADDHLIARYAADELNLDYLALGHWHSRQLFAGADGVERTAYPGVHEPFRFPDSSESRTGWVPYSSGQRERFLDKGKGEVLHVQLECRRATPVIQPLEVGHLLWQAETRSLSSDLELARLIDELAIRPTAERRLLLLSLKGVLDARAMLRMSQLHEVLDRYLFAEVDESGLHLQPREEEMYQVAGEGILRSLIDQLRGEAEGPDPAARPMAQRALLLLYQVSQEIKA
jgi:DNA repair exonuclease SbcCD nuclease subunit